MVTASSQTISFAAAKTLPALLDGEILHVLSAVVRIGILNRKCAVVPPSIRRAATPVEATANATSPLERTVSSKSDKTKVFPLPPGAYMKCARGRGGHVS